MESSQLQLRISRLLFVCSKHLDAKLRANFPSDRIGNLTGLASLVLNSNELLGYIPSTLGRLKNLKGLYIEHNELKGSIPNDLCRLKKMANLYLSDNKLNGPIPSCLGELGLMRRLFLDSNKLTSIIPLTLWSLKNLLYLNLPTNFLSGNIPSNIGNQSTWCGGVGSVYKGTLSDEVNVAIKVFNLRLEIAFKSFDVECGVLRNIRHRNLTKVISSCNNSDFITLVLKYMPNGSLKKWLFSHNYCLIILERLNIMVDVTSALEYLHHGQTTPILHCDLKPSNLLLDKDMIAHVCETSASPNS
ncbi:hypothetical protein LguiA_004596 [Lonicera macranthoides]